MHRWKHNGWKTAGNKDVQNKEDLKTLDGLCQQVNVDWVREYDVSSPVLQAQWSCGFPLSLKSLPFTMLTLPSYFRFQKYVPGHANIKGNEAADSLARAGARMESTR